MSHSTRAQWRKAFKEYPRLYKLWLKCNRAEIDKRAWEASHPEETAQRERDKWLEGSCEFERPRGVFATEKYYPFLISYEEFKKLVDDSTSGQEDIDTIAELFHFAPLVEAFVRALRLQVMFDATSIVGGLGMLLIGSLLDDIREEKLYVMYSELTSKFQDHLKRVICLREGYEKMLDLCWDLKLCPASSRYCVPKSSLPCESVTATGDCIPADFEENPGSLTVGDVLDFRSKIVKAGYNRRLVKYYCRYQVTLSGACKCASI